MLSADLARRVKKADVVQGAIEFHKEFALLEKLMEYARAMYHQMMNTWRSFLKLLNNNR